MNENVLAATTQMFFAIFLHSVSGCCIFSCAEDTPARDSQVRKKCFLLCLPPAYSYLCRRKVVVRALKGG